MRDLLVVGFLYTALSPFYFSQPYLHNSLCTKSVCFHICTSYLHISQISSNYFFLLSNPLSGLHYISAELILTICMWSLHASASNISTCLYSHNFLNICPMSCLIFQYITCLLYFGANTMWYLHLHLLCDKLFTSSCMTNLLCFLLWLPDQL